jgi:hypothetical protein
MILQKDEFFQPNIVYCEDRLLFFQQQFPTTNHLESTSNPIPEPNGRKRQEEKVCAFQS